MTESEDEHIPIINHWAFPDTSKFDGNILAESTVPSDDMETYAMQVLLHFSSYRSAEDLQINGSYVLRLREWAQTDQFDRTVRDTLNNIQNIRNAINLKRQDDLLDQQTLPCATALATGQHHLNNACFCESVATNV